MKTRADYRPVVAFFLFYYVFYSFFLHPFYSYDDLCYALDVEYGPPINLFHANHLFYNLTMRLVWSMMRGHASVMPRAIFTMQAINTMTAAGAVALLYRVLALSLGSRRAGLAAVLFGNNFALMQNASDSGCYAVASLASVFVLGLILKVNEWSAFRLGFLHGIAVLYHQLLILPAVTFCLRLRQRVSIALYLLGLASSCGMVYMVIGWYFHGPTIGSIFYWFTHYAGASVSPPGTRFIYFDLGHQGLVSLRALIESFSGSQDLAWLICFAVLLPISFKGDLPWVLWSWPVLFFCVQWIYFPSALTYRLLAWPALCALIAAGRIWKRTWAWMLALGFGVFLLVHNAITLHQRPIPYAIDMKRAYWLTRVAGPNDYFIFAGRGTDSITNVCMAYFAHAVPARSLYGYLFLQPNGDMTALNAQLSAVQSRGGRIFVESDLRDTHVLQSLEMERGLPSGTLAQTIQHWKPIVHILGPEGYAIDQAILDFHNNAGSQ